MNSTKGNILHDLAGEEGNQLLVVSDRNGNKLDVETRKRCHEGSGITHLAFMVYISDGSGRIIITKRSKNKSLWAGFWDASVVSHILPSETVKQAARRRTKEELGIAVDDFSMIGGFYYFALQGDIAENEYCNVLVGEYKEKIDPNSIEIDEVKKMSIRELIDKIDKDPDIFTPWLKISLDRFDLASIL